jgi:uncharacterized protein (DUF1810 family)
LETHISDNTIQFATEAVPLGAKCAEDDRLSWIVDRHDLNRFVTAQEGVYEPALAEIRAARKRTHWMWFIFPQIDGLGSSPTARHYAIKSIEEARAYLDHPILGPRLVACATALLAVEDRSALAIFGHPDDLKLRSCATLFAGLLPPGSVFERVLDKYFDGQRDAATLELAYRRDA